MAKDRDDYELRMAIGRMLLPMVSPYDLSDAALRLHYQNNPYFKHGVEAVFHLIESNPLTLEKVLNDMKIMAQFR